MMIVGVVHAHDRSSSGAMTYVPTCIQGTYIPSHPVVVLVVVAASHAPSHEGDVDEEDDDDGGGAVRRWRWER
jgi:hypothetical protein